MPPATAIIVPTRGRAPYLEVALASVAPQARAAGAVLVVADDGPDAATRAVAERFGARYVEVPRPGGVNAARNAGLAAAPEAELLILIDDDVAVWPGWLAALQAGPAGADVLTGPIRARIEGRRFPRCGRESGPVTEQDFGPDERDVPHAWGANLALRRRALERIGPFDPALSGGGDEQEWEDRLLAAGGRIRWLAAAGVDHRRAGDDARLRALCRAARGRGREARRFDERRGAAPPLARELRTLLGCAAHGPRRRCAMGPVMTWHTLGRLEAALRPGPPPPATPGVDDFLSGRSGNVEGRRAVAVARVRDLVLDVSLQLSGRLRRLDRAAATGPRRRVLALAVERRDLPGLLPAARAELARSRHDVELVVADAAGGSKFEHLNDLLAEHPPAAYDWVLVLDDDVGLPARFLDRFLAAAEAAGLVLAQPAHRRRSHAAWQVTRRVAGATARETNFVEIGPVTAFARPAAEALLPFPAEAGMGWGLDAHWGAVARARGWRIGIVDATPIAHTLRPAAATYPRAAAAAAARAFLAGRPYVTRDEVRTLAVRR
jgi:GT2 family glycosyltransferase